MAEKKVSYYQQNGLQKGMVFIVKLEKPVILASGSPRRRELLAQANFTFTVCPAKGEEHTTKTLPYEIVCELSHQKALEIAQTQKNACYVIGADTIVAFENHILGKPKNPADAIRMVSMLQGNTHQVYTGVTLIEICADGILREKTFYEETRVHVCPMTKEDIASYVATGEPLDKAGAYGIQGAFSIYISGIEGDYFNVVGLPISRLYHEIKMWL